MKIETIDLHGLSQPAALAKAKQNIDWAVNHGVDVIVLNHGKGRHSDRNFSVIKKEIRKMLKEDNSISSSGYRIVLGESNLPVALTYDEGNTLLVYKGCENEMIGGRNQQEKHKQIFSNEARLERKIGKKLRAEKRSRPR
jgi:hypothetical protein